MGTSAKPSISGRIGRCPISHSEDAARPPVFGKCATSPGVVFRVHVKTMSEVEVAGHLSFLRDLVGPGHSFRFLN